VPRAKSYLDTDVLTAARERIRHIYDVFDHVVVAFSGGKDSSVCLWLSKEVHEERGLGKVQAVFWDEEVLPMSNIDLLTWYKDQPWLDLKWFCMPYRDRRFVLGQFREHIRWDRSRANTRPKPEWAIEPEDIGMSYDEFVESGGPPSDDIVLSFWPTGKFALVTGIRASESLSRFRSVVNKLNENYICMPEGVQKTRLRLCKPIYDWMENDVLKFIHDNDVPLCSQYEAQEMAQNPLRIGPPMDSGAAGRFGKIREYEPEWYQALIDVFPEMTVHERYWQEFDVDSLVEKYSDGFKGVLRYIEEWLPKGPVREHALRRYNFYKKMHQKRPNEFPPELLLKMTIKGGRERKFRGLSLETKESVKKNAG
jgi:predicted phosphoadenosine phosphosulfate sulfurtransferase